MYHVAGVENLWSAAPRKFRTKSMFRRKSGASRRKSRKSREATKVQTGNLEHSESKAGNLRLHVFSYRKLFLDRHELKVQDVKC